MKHSPRSVRFPSVAFASREEFEAYRQANRPVIDGRYLHETSLASADPLVVRSGTCAPCLRPAVFTSSTLNGEAQGDGRVMPNWRDHQLCDCEDRLPQSARALLHFAEAGQSLHDWTRLLLFGRSGPADRRLAAMAQRATSVARLRRAGFDDELRARYRIDAADGYFHTVVSTDYLQHVPPLPAALAEVRRVLVPGGRFIFTVPFRIMSAETETVIHRLPLRNGALPVEIDDDAHQFGWDILDHLHEAGFEDPLVHTYWSDELGYLGSFKTILTAIA
jgi:SAM-dependent methyltransferase